MAYDSGILLAAGGDVYTQLMDAIKAFCETAGWTTNLYDDDESYYAYAAGYTWYASGGYAGKRLHMQKTINGTARFINIRSIQDQSPFRLNSSTQGIINGLAINGSTGYSAAARWDQQPGACYDGYHYRGAILTDLPEDSLQYYIFSYDNGNNIYLQCANGYGYVGFVFGVTSYDVFVVGGSASDIVESAGVTHKNALLFRASSNYYQAAFWAYIDSTWYQFYDSTSVGCKLPSHSLIGNVVSEFSYPHPANLLLYSSPDSFKGNAPLIPVNMMIAQTSGVLRRFGTLPGVKYVNMKNIASLTEETYGADTYKFFRQYNVDDADQKFGGLAFLIS